jgi:tetratricopeptide (TPR) repeat protein
VGGSRLNNDQRRVGAGAGASVGERRGRSGRGAWATILARTVAGLVVAIAASSCKNGETALTRGDRLWADSNYTAALAEYRLALRQGENDDQVVARVAHAYIQTGQFERGREYYDRLIQRSPEYADQAVFDYFAIASRAHQRLDRYGLAQAVEAALALRPGLPLEQMAVPLARYYATTGAADRAIEFYERALAQAPSDSVPALLFELGEVHEASGNCEEALGFFNAYRARGRGDRRMDEARWHVANCSFILGRRARQIGEYETALRRLDTVIELGVPQNIQDQAWFEHGESLVALGRTAEALSSFQMVLELNRARTGQLVERAQRRIDELRFGRIFN